MSQIININRTNSMTQAYAEQYFTDFCRMFEITENGSLRSTKLRLEEIQEWFNRSYVFISLISGIPLVPIEFTISNTKENNQILLHVYAVSYTVLLRMCFSLGRTVPEKYRPTIVDFDEEES